jgi:sugar phosphate isomerase/epimerase
LRSHINRDFPAEDFPKVVRDSFGISGIEICQAHLKNASAGELEELRSAIVSQGCTHYNFPIDLGDVSQADEDAREKDLRAIEGWIETAAQLGARNVRVNVGKSARADGASVDIGVASFRRLADRCGQLGMGLLIENHGGISSDPAFVVRFVEDLGLSNVGTCPDFGNFPEKVRYSGLEALMPYARHVHVKTHDFDESGGHPSFDVGRCLQIVHKSGYQGPYSIEFEGKGDQYEGIRLTKELLLSHL